MVANPGATFDLNGFVDTIGSLAGSGNVTMGVGALVVGGDGTNATFSGTISGSAGTPNDYVAGLLEGRLAGAFDITDPNPSLTHPENDPNPGGAIKLGPVVGQVHYAASTGPWVDNSTYVYTGWWYKSTDTAEFAKQFDNSVYLKIDGVVYMDLFNTGNPNIYNIPSVSGNISAPAVATNAWHSFEVRFGQAGGGVGPSVANGWNSATMGFGINTAGPFIPVGTAPNSANYTIPLDNGTMNLFKTLAPDNPGASGLYKIGTGTQVLGNANTYAGVTVVNGGVLQAGVNNAIGSSSDVTVNAAGTFDLNGTSDTIGSLAGAGNVTLGTNGAADRGRR